MPFSSEHMRWLVDTGNIIKTADCKDVKVFELCHEQDDATLTLWAKHFRNHYCLDNEIDFFREGYDYSRKDYLNIIKFPDKVSAPGPNIRAGDFGEVLVADYLEYIMGFWVPRTRYADKTIRNESTKGCDIIGFKFVDDASESPEDTLAIFEAKAQFSGRKPKERLQNAIDDSKKDVVRKAESLNAIKQRLFYRADRANAVKVNRFQNEADRPYRQIYGAAALFDSSVYNSGIITTTDTSSHPRSNDLHLIVITGDDLMRLVHNLYRRAANEA